MFKNIIALLVLIAAAGAAVAETGQEAQNIEAAKPAVSQYPHKGTVLEVVESPMYNYLQVTCDTGTLWLATGKSINKIAKGDTVSYSSGGVVMRNFYSKSLNRSVEKIIFVKEVVPETK